MVPETGTSRVARRLPRMPAASAFWDGRRVVVTGGAGFLGRRVVAELQSAGADVVAVRSRDYDLTRPGAAADMLADHRPAQVIHLAARVGGIGFNQAEPASLYLANLLMGTYVIEAARALPASTRRCCSAPSARTRSSPPCRSPKTTCGTGIRRRPTPRTASPRRRCWSMPRSTTRSTARSSPSSSRRTSTAPATSSIRPSPT